MATMWRCARRTSALLYLPSLWYGEEGIEISLHEAMSTESSGEQTTFSCLTRRSRGEGELGV